MLIYFYKSTRKNLYNLLGLSMFIWYTCLRWTIQTNTLGSFILDSDGKWNFVLNWIFTPINMATAFLSIYFISNILVEFNKSFNPLMGLIAFFITWRNCYYTLEDYRDYIINPSTLQFIFIIIDIAMIIYVLIWALSYCYWSMNNVNRSR